MNVSVSDGRPDYNSRRYFPTRAADPILRQLRQRIYSLYAGTACALVIGLTCALIVIIPGAERRRSVVRAGVRTALVLTGCRLRVSGAEHLPTSPCIVTSNHQSYLDGPLIMAVLPARFGFVVKEEVRRWPLIGRAVTGVGAVYISRTDARRSAPTTRGLIRHIAEGGSLAMFPEGTFRAEPGLMPFRPGAFMIAAHNGAAVVPVSITGTRSILPSDSLSIRRGDIHVQFHPPVHATGSDRSAALKLRDDVHALLSQATGEPDISHEGSTLPSRAA